MQEKLYAAHSANQTSTIHSLEASALTEQDITADDIKRIRARILNLRPPIESFELKKNRPASVPDNFGHEMQNSIEIAFPSAVITFGNSLEEARAGQSSQLEDITVSEVDSDFIYKLRNNSDATHETREYSQETVGALVYDKETDTITRMPPDIKPIASPLTFELFANLESIISSLEQSGLPARILLTNHWPQRYMATFNNK